MSKYVVIKEGKERKCSDEKIKEAKDKLANILNDENNLFPYEIDKKQLLMDIYQELIIDRRVLLSLVKNGLKIDDNKLVELIRKNEILTLLVDYLFKDLDISIDDKKLILKR